MLKRFIVTAMGLSLMIGCTQMIEKRAAVIKAPEAAPGAAYVGSDTCAECHEDYVSDTHDVHMRIASHEAAGYKSGCEGCHGPASLHVEGGGDTEKILRFGRDGLDAEEVAGVCVTCHQGGEITHWSTSGHALSDVSCTDCHTVHHNRNGDLLAKETNLLCNSCHRDIMAKTNFMSHHPIKEGKMTCSACHQPHGSAGAERGMLRTEERVNDLCLNCHTRYQGPFVYEHDPVIESCVNCHEPHGSVANNLLKQQEPFLCLQCHEGHFHSLRASNAVTPVTPAGAGADKPFPGASGTIEPVDHGFQMSFMTKCTQCHSQIHGSDLPSQAVTGQGRGLTR